MGPDVDWGSILAWCHSTKSLTVLAFLMRVSDLHTDAIRVIIITELTEMISYNSLPPPTYLLWRKSSKPATWRNISRGDWKILLPPRTILPAVRLAAGTSAVDKSWQG